MANLAGARERWHAIQRELGQRLSRQLFEEVSRRPVTAALGRDVRPMTRGLLAAYAVSALVHGASVGAGALAIALPWLPWTNMGMPVLAVILVLLSIATRPRLGRRPDDLLSRSEYPTLYKLTDRIAHAMQTAPIHGIGVSADFGANYRHAGLRNRRYIELGTPLLAILSRDERVAVIAHELSHGANGDPLRGWFLYGAVNTLSTWAIAIRPLSIGRMGEGSALGPFLSILGIPFELTMLAISELLFLCVKGLLLLVLRQSQRSEYLADLLAATIAGSAQMQSALEKTYLFDLVDAEIHHHTLTTPDAPLAGRMFVAVQELPLSAMERYRSESRELQWQVDSTHPPTALRVDMLRLQPQHVPSSLLSVEEGVALDVEVERLVSLSERELVSRKLEAINGWR
jgi:Zn-dependent protease with chaperone function